MRSRGGVVGHGGVRCSVGVALLHDGEQLFGRPSGLLVQSLDLDVVVLVLQNSQRVLGIQQIVAPSSVDLEEAHSDTVVLRQLVINLVHDLLLDSIHGVCLSGSCLPVGEASDDPVVEQSRNNGFEDKFVDVVSGLCKDRTTSSSLKVLSKVNWWFSMYLVIPSTLYLGSWILIMGLAQEMASISPACSYFLKTGLFLTQTES